jgi:hypothetical protein
MNTLISYAESFLAFQRIPLISYYFKAQYNVHKLPPLNHVPSQLKVLNP